ncbi:hypothetical protein D9757_008219 [Collybiopsis confluens]|uniref:CRAL-TRIO domain-containing protein n=1 Tax=Collybiopsis confluens TaxID=2823264 RepID=A0A8H5HBH8_9AGAR|nr:hypothetical protein D9757_008219 [Collybiopsis confluens]
MDTRLLLQANCDRLLEQYELNVNVVKALQGTLIQDILPSVVDELALDAEQIDWAKQWLQDSQAIFQLLRVRAFRLFLNILAFDLTRIQRENYTRSFAIESIRKNLLWRCKNLWPPEPEPSLSRVHLLPTDVRDPFGRPILVIRAVGFNDSEESYFPLLIRAMEQFRLRLNKLNDVSHPIPVLQYVVLLDVKELSVQTLSLDLISWVLRDLIPRFPGMLAAGKIVFILNSSWAHSGMWNMTKRFLPGSAASRVFFPSQKELVALFAPSTLPKDYGGSLPSLNSLTGTSTVQVAPPPPDPRPVTPTAGASTNPIYLAPTSILNPFFGYPVSSSRGYPTLHHGRRRKRDLLRTLAALFWLRWGRRITVCLWLVALAFAGRVLWFRRWQIYSPSKVSLLKNWMAGIP